MIMPWTKIAGILMFLGVALVAFGSHALRDKLTDYYLDVYKTAVLYHFIHALGLFVIAWILSYNQNHTIVWAGVCFLLGILLFSGSLYLLSVTQIKWLGAITPLGGLSFLL